ncbi:MAG: protein-glutamate O-methyltransferase CheR [Bacillota bacterium]|nr:protein-glutamate O-methyltransferase CheR [Bacillota bacterium]
MFDIKDKEFTKLSEYMKTYYGINLKPEKKPLVVSRLQNVLSECNFPDFTTYLNYVMSDKTGEAATTLINKLTTNHTFFMREAEHFSYFKNTVLPYLSSTQTNKKDLRIWSAGCSSGEEPYTLAMIISDYFGPSRDLWDTKILATDISSNVLEEATKAKYSNEEISELPKLWKTKYFESINGQNFRVCETIRSEVIFRKFNLNNTSFPFSKKFHVIFCRNVMIYFDSNTKNELVDKFYKLTEPGGYLFIGLSESLDRNESKYNYIMPSVYRRD